MIDRDGYRPSVGIIVSNRQRQVLWARRGGSRNAWQFPQGGIDRGESLEDALYRELHEELGLESSSVEVLGTTSDWLRYEIPRRFLRRNRHPVCIGQRQRWFLLRLLSHDDAVRVDAHPKPEFDRWRWAGYWEPIDSVIYFKRPVYERVLREFAPIIGVSRRPDDGGREPAAGRESRRRRTSVNPREVSH